MPGTNLPTFEYADERVRLVVVAGGGVTIHASGDGVGTSVFLTVVGAQRLASMLGSAITAAITRGTPTER